MFTIKQMTYFDALARERHFGRAASRASVTQPALSAQIAEMERLVGQLLFERNRNGVVLTEVGRRLLPVIEGVLAQMQRINDIVSTADGPMGGTLRLGMIPTIAPYLLPVLLPALSQRFPLLTLKVREAVTQTLVGELNDGGLDVIVAATPIGDDRLVAKPLFTDRFFIASSTNTHDVLTSPVTQDAVAMERLLLLDEGHCLRDQALAVCATDGARQLVNFGATSMTTLLQMVTSGMGMTLLPEIALGAETQGRPHLIITPFAPPEPYREVAFFYRPTTERAATFDNIGACIASVGRGLLQP
jgi:LysR family hydrogen peroxide-inducible transcriptional activator